MGDTCAICRDDEGDVVLKTCPRRGCRMHVHAACLQVWLDENPQCILCGKYWGWSVVSIWKKITMFMELVFLIIGVLLLMSDMGYLDACAPVVEMIDWVIEYFLIAPINGIITSAVEIILIPTQYLITCHPTRDKPGRPMCLTQDECKTLCRIQHKERRTISRMILNGILNDGGCPPCQ